jgi:hypothetical protein
VDTLTSEEKAIAARRLAAMRPSVAALADIAAPEAFWELCRDELSGVDVAESWRGADDDTEPASANVPGTGEAEARRYVTSHGAIREIMRGSRVRLQRRL